MCWEVSAATLERVWNCDKYWGESSSGWGKVLGKEQIIQEKNRGCSGSGKAVVHSGRVDNWGRAGVHSRTSSCSRELSTEGFKMCKDSVNEGNYGVYHREELSEEAERRNWEKGVEVREAKDYKLREMEGNEDQEKAGAGEQSLWKLRAAQKDVWGRRQRKTNLQMLTSQHEAEEWLLKGKQVLMRSQRDYGVGTSSTP